MSPNLYVNGFSQSGVEHLASVLNLAYPTMDLVKSADLSEQYQNSMAYIVHTLGQDPDAVFLITIREPIDCLEAAILMTSEGPKRIPIEISMDALVKLYNTFHWELLDRDRVVLVPLDELLSSPNSVLDRLDSVLGGSSSGRLSISDSDYLQSIATDLVNSWERISVSKNYGPEQQHAATITKELNNGRYSIRLSLLESLYNLLLAKSKES